MLPRPRTAVAVSVRSRLKAYSFDGDTCTGPTLRGTFRGVSDLNDAAKLTARAGLEMNRVHVRAGLVKDGPDLPRHLKDIVPSAVRAEFDVDDPSRPVHERHAIGRARLQDPGLQAVGSNDDLQWLPR